MTTEERLEEREKELACIYSICLMAAGAPEPELAVEGMARSLCAAMQGEALAICTVAFEHPGSGKKLFLRRGEEAFDSGAAASPADLPRIEAFLPPEAADGWTGSVAIEYRDRSLRFLPQEKALLDSVIVVMTSVLRTAGLIAALRSASADLRAKNIALREILSMIEEEKRLMVLAFRERLVGDILPLAERAREPGLSPERQAAYLGLLADELGREVTTLGPAPLAEAALSIREREVAVQVRNGRTSKEIAEILGIAEATVERHRHNIRRKLRIANSGVNLAGLLGSEKSVQKEL